MGSAGGPSPSRHRDPHDGLPAAGWRSSAADSSTACRRRRLSVGFVSGLDYRDPMFDPHVRFQHFKRHPFVSGLLEGGQMVRYGAKALPEGGWHTIPRVLRRRRADRRGRRRVHELDAPEGHPPRDAHRHARRRDGVRGGPQGDVSADAADGLRGRDRRQRRAERALSGPQRAPELRLRTARGPRLLGPLARDRRLVVRDPMPAHAGYERMQKLADYYRDGRPDPDVAR